MEEVRGENKGDNGGVDALAGGAEVMKSDDLVMNGQQKRAQGRGNTLAP